MNSTMLTEGWHHSLLLVSLESTETARAQSIRERKLAVCCHHVEHARILQRKVHHVSLLLIELTHEHHTSGTLFVKGVVKLMLHADELLLLRKGKGIRLLLTARAGRSDRLHV